MAETRTETGARPAMGRRERKAAETRERIFRSAIELFAERGPAHVTVEQITERADVGKGTFFNYFPNKEAVLTYFGGTQVQRLRAALESGEIHGTPPERIRHLLEVMGTYPDMTPDLARGLFLSALSHSELQEIEGPNIWQLQGILEEIIREGQASGYFKPEAAADEVALFLLGQYFLALLSWCTSFHKGTLLDTVRSFTGFALDGVIASPSPSA